MASALYAAAAHAALPLSLPLLALHPRARGGFAERFLGAVPRLRGQRPVWLHGASAGDVRALLPLANALEAAGIPAVLSAGTASGAAVLRADGYGNRAFRAPLDVGFAVRRALRRIRPRLLVLERLEAWPALLGACAAAGVPAAIVNGRMSARSARWYRRLASLFAPRFAGLALVSAIGARAAERFVAAGARPERVVVAPSSKHGRLPPPPPPSQRRDAIVAGSIHPREEDPLVRAIAPRLRARPRLRAVFAPRHPHRAAAVRRLLARQGIAARLAPSADACPPGGALVLDRMGGLPGAYRWAALAIVGGSFVRRGGHNPVEPAAAGAPVVMGPSVEACAAEVAALEAAGACLRAPTPAAAGDIAGLWLADPGALARRGRAARAVAEDLARGAAATAARLIRLAGAS